MLRSEEEDIWQEQPDPNLLYKTLELQQELITNIKTLWYENYLLRQRQQGWNIYQNKWENRIKVGDRVLVKFMNKFRLLWMLCKILENIIGFDNKIRAVKLKQGNGAIEHYSISNLYPMEISSSQNHY